MPVYDFKCELCGGIKSIRSRITDDRDVECCGVEMRRTFLKAPGTVVTPSNQAYKDKFKYYGIKNAVTGEGITKDTDVSQPPGITTGTLE